MKFKVTLDGTMTPVEVQATMNTLEELHSKAIKVARVKFCEYFPEAHERIMAIDEAKFIVETDEKWCLPEGWFGRLRN